MKTLKDNINKLSLEDLKTLLNKDKTRGIQYLVLSRLIHLSEYGKTDEISEKSFELGKDKFSINILLYLSEYSKTDKISEESFNLGKDKFGVWDLLNLSKYGKTDKIRKESRELLDINEEFNINKYIEK